MIVIIAFSVSLLCLVSLNRKSVAYSKKTVNTYVRKIEKCTNKGGAQVTGNYIPQGVKLLCLCAVTAFSRV